MVVTHKGKATNFRIDSSLQIQQEFAFSNPDKCQGAIY